ncbi:hypothetical protein AMIS_41820 [Actinoplanes missouriensis 431]|uniref:Uncharacterized protein n=1 Tax=Actinoplanes missouriensis (strain ATCC 14538 / DSM 43046 / CBS 188.64 / JCM 3121 / NBRC 102363 / NCIMB 12654 / NRRL B-3342 / UNCC 431) TaxID=512565 RepID=I0H8R5_ACTM4|nr:hypothetical protein [Actinoplanes missouriensis]BAL89402.1 hypothetical protein AMIS_41820 [Actinoplanes missouriensis 431]
MTSSDLWDEETAQRYDDVSAEMSSPAVVGPAVDVLARLAGVVLERRVADGNAAPVTSDSESHVSVWRKPR